jgi:hypothetical protein
MTKHKTRPNYNSINSQNTTTMTRPFILLTTLASAFTLVAQPTLTFQTNAPVPGSQYEINYGGLVAPGNSGAMQIWDLSGLISDSTEVIHFVAPSSTTNGDQFPNSTIAEISNDVTTYYLASSDGLYFTGSDDGTSVIVNTTVPKYIEFPCTMGSSWNEPHGAVFDYDGENVIRSGVISCEADGYGTLIMPWGTVPNVLRIHMVNEMQDILNFFTLQYSYDSYLYLVAGQSWPIAELVSATIDFGFGSPEVVELSRWASANTTGIDPPSLTNSDLSVYPNPTSDLLNIVVTKDMGANSSVMVLDATGRSVHQEKLVVFSGSTAQVDLRHLVPGIYTLVISGGNGLHSTTQVSLL